ncbi:MAG: filamentous hemagglutinin N-terminal domain-containing protein [Nitrospira sp.]|nr:filamentous hemagglutinin N-terminal domain-containing protein [Nitrospira sp.]
MKQSAYIVTGYLTVDGAVLARALQWWKRGQRLLVTALTIGIVLCTGPVRECPANPVNPSVVAGEASVTGLGTDRVTIQQASRHAIIHWGQFNIAPNEVTSFLQPVGGVALNRIYDANPSLINGMLNATGTVFLLNPNGVLFGANAQVNVGGLVASTLHMTDADFLAGNYRFGGTSTHLGLGDTALNGMVRNEGQITAGPFGVYLFAHNVSNAGIIRSDGGHIALAAGASAYLTNRPDGRGLFVEVKAPTGQATNLGDLIADGGQVSLFGKVVNQSGMIQANSVQAKNGRVELIATDAVTLADGSRILVKGDTTGVSHGGTVIAKADLTTGRTDFKKGALIDVSGGTKGGNGGFIELSGSRVSWEGAFRAHAIAGYRGGKLLIDPVFTDSNSITTATLNSFTDSGLNDIEFQSTGDMTVTARFDLSAWLLPAGQTGTLTFNAGRNLLFNSASITNGERGQGTAGSRWDYKLFANEHIEIRGSTISTGLDGSITMEAGRSPTAFGDIRLTQLNANITGQPMLETFAGGDITITTDRDLIAPSGLIGGVVTGIRLNQLGNLTMNIGRNFLGGLAGNSQVGPGFLLGNGTATVNVGTNVGPDAGQHPTGGHVGWDGTTTAPLYANITVGGGRIDDSGLGKLTEVFKTTVNMNARGNIYLGLVQDRGLVEDLFETGDSYITIHQDSSVALLSSMGDIFLKPQLANSAGGINAARRFYPASFDAQAPEGRILIESDLNFWPSVTGRLNFFAKQDLSGSVRQVGTRRDPQYKLVFVGDDEKTGSWQLLFIPTASKDPKLGRFIARPENLLSQPTLLKKPKEQEFSEAQWPSIPQFSGAPVVTQRQGDLKVLQGIFSDKAVELVQPLPQGVDPTHQVQEVNFKSETGGIYSLVLNLLSPVFRKQVTVEAGRDIGVIVEPTTGARTGGEFTLITSVPEGATATVKAGGNMGFSRNCPTCFETGLEFVGRGIAKVRVGSLDATGNPVPGTGNLDLGDGRGIQHGSLEFGEVNGPGLIDIGVGKDIVMTQTRIVSHNGADIWIHGLGTKPALNPDGSPTNQLVQGVVLANILTVDGKPVKVDGVPIVLDGTQPVISQGTVVLDRPGQLINGKPFTPVLAKGKPIVVDGRIVLLVDGQIQLVDASLVSIEQATGGKLTVGTFGSNPNSGILSIRGGNIDIKTKGDVDVFQSRIATLTGGNISIYSTEGDINAGSGGRNESIEFVIDQGKDEFGRDRPDLVFLVPGSGIFTHHGSDPKFPLNFPKFDTPAIEALKGEIVKQNFLGRNTSVLEDRLADMVAAREPMYRQIFERFITQNPDKGGLPLELGDINLRAGRDLVVPSAGIRGRRIRIFAGRNLDLQGGTIEGDVQFDVEGAVKGNLSSFVGAFSGTAAIGGSVSGGSSAGGSSLGGGLSGVTGTVSATASATSSTSVTASKTVETVQEKTTESSTQQARATAEKQVVASTDAKDGKSKGPQLPKMKRGVVIQVDVKPQAQPGN